MSAVTRCTVAQGGVKAYAPEPSLHHLHGWQARVCPAALLLLPAVLSISVSNTSTCMNQLSAGR